MELLREFIESCIQELHVNKRLRDLPKKLVMRHMGLDQFGHEDRRLSADTVEANKHRELAFETVEKFITDLEETTGEKLHPIMVHNLKRYTRTVWASVWKDVEHDPDDAKRVLKSKLRNYYDKRIRRLADLEDED